MCRAKVLKRLAPWLWLEGSVWPAHKQPGETVDRFFFLFVTLRRCTRYLLTGLGSDPCLEGTVSSKKRKTGNANRCW